MELATSSTSLRASNRHIKRQRTSSREKHQTVSSTGQSTSTDKRPEKQGSVLMDISASALKRNQKEPSVAPFKTNKSKSMLSATSLPDQTQLKHNQQHQRSRQKTTSEKGVGGVLTAIDEIDNGQKIRKTKESSVPQVEGANNAKKRESVGGILSTAIPKPGEKLQQSTKQRLEKKVSGKGKYLRNDKGYSHAKINQSQVIKQSTRVEGTGDETLHSNRTRSRKIQEQNKGTNSTNPTGLMAFAGSLAASSEPSDPPRKTNPDSLKSTSDTKTDIAIPASTQRTVASSTKAQGTSVMVPFSLKSATNISIVTKPKKYNDTVSGNSQHRTGSKGTGAQYNTCSLAALPPPPQQSAAASRKLRNHSSKTPPRRAKKGDNPKSQVVAKVDEDKSAKSDHPSQNKSLKVASNGPEERKNKVKSTRHPARHQAQRHPARDTKKTSHESILSELSDGKDEPKAALPKLKRPVQIIELSSDSSSDDEDLKQPMGRKPKAVIELSSDSSDSDEMSRPMSRPKASSHRSRRLRQPPERFADQYHHPKDESKRLVHRDDQDLGKLDKKVEQLVDVELGGILGIPFAERTSMRRGRRSSDRKSIKPARFGGEVNSEETNEAEKASSPSRPNQPKQQLTRKRRRSKRKPDAVIGNNESLSLRPRRRSKRCKSGEESEVDPISVDEDTGTFDEDVDDTSSGETEDPLSIAESKQIDFNHVSASLRDACSTKRPMKVCYDQVELVENNDVLVDGCWGKAAVFAPIRDQCTFDGPVGNNSTARPLRSVTAVDKGVCCYDELEVACGKSYIRMLANLPPVITRLEEQEQSKTVPRQKNKLISAADPVHQAQLLAVGLRKRDHRRRAPQNPPKDDQPEAEIVWSSNDLAMLKQAYKQANAKSPSFWDDVASMVEGKTASSCREKWFSLANTPPRKTVAARKCIVSSSPVSAEDEDDLFNSTPLRGSLTTGDNPESSSEKKDKTTAIRGFPSFNIGSPLKFEKKVLSLPSLSDDEDDLSMVDFRFKPGYKTYIRDMKKKVRQSQQQRQKPKGKSKKNSQMVSERFADGDVEMRGDLSPGGTLRVKSVFSDVEDDTFFDGSDDEEDESM
ncbi:expressed unknown protein [Seminavis robusta]|uniref:Myb-like domain-containing protein n=1 Tax=Seminavis robusta TaxID=568900 RepID=A0A9N8DLA0_9STRA|nr:expressed unknown protein [Seminavis robusta]|eukprot:Sro142_g066020.1 n/a (1090) ;mRNA; f:2356-5625